MAEAIAIPAGGGIPPIPAGATVAQHSRELPPPAGQQIPGYVPQAPAQPVVPPQAPAQPAAPVAPAGDLTALLAALQGLQPAAPVTPVPAPQVPVQPQTTASDPMLSSMTAILASSGLDVQRAIGNALNHGDVSLVDQRYIAEAGGANAAHLQQIAAGIVQHAVRETAAAEQAVYAAAGGQANWDAAVGAFEQIAPPHLKVVIKQLFDSGDRSSVDAATRTVLEFAKANGATLQPAGLVQAGAGLSAAGALDKAEFQAALRGLNRNDRGYEQARAELFSRRQAGKNMGRN